MKPIPALSVRFRAALEDEVGHCQELIASCRVGHARHCVHRLRIQARRLIACIDLVGDLISRRRRQRARRKLKTVLRALGPARDAEVQREQLGALALHHPDCRHLEEIFRRHERRARGAAGSAMKRIHLGKSLKRIGQPVRADTPSPAGDAQLRRAMHRAIQRARERLDDRWPHLTADREAFHRARVALKRYRYQLEMLEILTGSVKPGALDRLRLDQKRLGDLHDCHLMLVRVERLSAKGRISDDLRHLLRPKLQRRIARLRRACPVAPPSVSTRDLFRA